LCFLLCLHRQLPSIKVNLKAEECVFPKQVQITQNKNASVRHVLHEIKSRRTPWYHKPGNTAKNAERLGRTEGGEDRACMSAFLPAQPFWSDKLGESPSRSRSPRSRKWVGQPREK
jgi:hypothetical protein